MATRFIQKIGADYPTARVFGDIRNAFRRVYPRGLQADQEHVMKERVDFIKIAPEVYKAMSGLQACVNQSGLERPLLELVKTRASQINGCAFCLDMHTLDARAQGETEQRLHLLPAWREAPFYSARERAALAWTEALTRVEQSQVPDEVYAEARQQFSEKELVDLSLAIVAINGWNRLCVAFRRQPGHYKPAGH
jgi:AhpD family alkylhydroperoxidase